MSCRLSFVFKLFAVSWVLLLPLIWLDDMPYRDTASRYIPMAQAMINSDWQQLFWLRVPPLFPMLIGAVMWLTGGTGIVAAQMVSAAAFALTLFPLYSLLRRVFDPEIAKIGGVLFLFSSDLLDLATTGLRESLKGLFLVWAVLALITVWQERARWRGFLEYGVAGALMVMVRDDSVLIVLLLGGAILGFDLAARRFPWRTIVAGIMALAMILPVLAANYRFNGYAVPSFRFAIMARNLGIPAYVLGKFGAETGHADAMTAIDAAEPQPAVSESATADSRTECAGLVNIWNTADWPDFLSSFFKGMLWYYLLPAAAVIIWRWRHRQWQTPETVLLAVFLGHAAAIIAQIIIFDRYIYVSKRYLLPAAALELGWTALAVRSVFQWMNLRKPAWKPWLKTVGAGLLLLLYSDALQDKLKDYLNTDLRMRRKTVLHLADRIRRESTPVYRAGTGMTPVVWSPAIPILGVVAGGSAGKTVGNPAAPPDYRLEQAGTTDLSGAGYEPVEAVKFRGRNYVLWRQMSRHKLTGL